MWGRQFLSFVLLIGCGGSSHPGGSHVAEGGEAGVRNAGSGGARAGSGGSKATGGDSGDDGTAGGRGGGIADGGAGRGGGIADGGEAGAGVAGDDSSMGGGNDDGSGAGTAGATGRGGAGNGGAGASTEEGGSGGGHAGRGDSSGTSGAGGEGGGDGSDCFVFVSMESGDDANDGTSWSASFASVSRALSAVHSGCEVWIAEGTYRPGTERTSTFAVPAGVTLRGGFDGTETSSEGRDVATRRTILSGDLGEPFVSSDNALHVVTTAGDATLDGLEITGGNANTNALDKGGGVLAGGPLTLLGCNVFDNSSAGNGGGVYSEYGLQALNTTFTNNTAGYYGGAILAVGPNPVSIYDGAFLRNTALEGGGISAYDASIAIIAEFVDNAATRGAAVWANGGSTLNVNGAKFAANRGTDGSIVFSGGSSVFAAVEFVDNVGGAILHTNGPTLIASSSFTSNEGSSVSAGQHLGSCDLFVADTTFEENASYRGAGISSFDCPVHVANSSFAGNEASDVGGAIAYQSESGELHVEQSVFENNTAAWHGGALYVHYGSARLERNTFIANSSSRDGGALYGYAADSMLVTGCRFLKNHADWGGGAVALLMGPLDVRTSEFQKNTARWGGAVHRTFTEGPLAFVNATFSRNVAETGAAVDSHGTVVIRNSILWEDEPAEVVLGTGSISGAADPDVLTLTANNLTGNYPNLVVADPKFVDANGDLRLSHTSPCIDTADDAFAELVDLAGNARRDVPGVPVCTESTQSCGSIADMGAYEFGY